MHDLFIKGFLKAAEIQKLAPQLPTAKKAIAKKKQKKPTPAVKSEEREG